MKNLQLPDSAIEHLRQLFDDAEGHQWRCGDALAELIDEFQPAYELEYGKRGRAQIIRQVANKIGRDESTLRDRLSVAIFFPPEIRAEYFMLSWSQLRACKSAGDKWREYADWSVENLPAPTSLIRAKIKANGDGLPIWSDYWERIISLAERLSREENLPDKIKAIIKAILESE